MADCTPFTPPTVQLHNGGMTTSADDWWLAVLDRLSPQVPEMAEDFTAQLAAEVPAYAELPRDEITATARESLTALIARLSGRSDAGELRSLSEDLGRRRTARGSLSMTCSQRSGWTSVCCGQG